MLFFLGLVCFIGGIYFLLVNLNIINKKIKVENDKPIEARKIDNMLIRFVSIILCLLGIYLIWPNQSTNISSSNVEKLATNPFAGVSDIRVWSNDLKEIITRQCLENGKRTAAEYPEIVKDYCKCATEKISQTMTPDEYTKWMDKPGQEQAAIIRPIVQSCVDIMMKLIELTQENKPKKEELNKDNLKGK